MLPEKVGDNLKREMKIDPHLNVRIRFFSYVDCGVEKCFLFLLNILSMHLVVLGLSYSLWDLAPWPGTEPGYPALGARSLRLWTTWKVLRSAFSEEFPV